MMANILSSTTLLIILAGFAAIAQGNLAQASDIGSKLPSGDSRRGEELYRASCVVCHGPRATGGIGPRLANNPVLLNDEAFWKIVYKGQHVMPPLKGAVTEQQMADILAWLKTLR